MKVLWFANTPSLAEEVLFNKPMSGGWIKSLDKYLQHQLDLHIAFIHHEKIKPFSHGKTSYYPIYRGNIFLYTINNLFFPNYYDKLIINKSIKIINEIGPDLIHIHGTENSFTQLNNYISVPVLYSIQGILTSIAETFNQLRKPHLLNFRFKFAYKSYLRRAHIERESLKKIKYLISKSEWSTNVLKVIAPNARTYKLDNILKDDFYRYKWNFQDVVSDKLVLTSIVSDKYYKGIDTVIYVSQLLDNLKVKFEWRVIGMRSDARMIDYVKKAYKIKAVSSNIIFKGRLSDIDIINNLLESRLFILVSHIENSPNNLAEALNLGLPCIAVNVGGVSSFIVSGENGILVPDYDWFNLCGVILRYCSDIEFLNNISQNAIIHSEKKHNINEIVEKQFLIYKEILKSEKELV